MKTAWRSFPRCMMWWAHPTAMARAILGMVPVYTLAPYRVNHANRWLSLVSPIHRACVGGHVEAIEVLLDVGDCLEAQNLAGWTPLLKAARYANDEAVIALLSRGANVRAVNEYGYTALHLACKHGTEKTVSTLLAAGADPNAKTHEGMTPLHSAAKGSQYAEKKKLLLAAGTDGYPG
ncbi:MAG: ankyrin repeat domain-containing protein [Phycisphaerae bacterium]|nr:ankyrin repeat domain-containing protein [Phycisphaerae bacterium]